MVDYNTKKNETIFAEGKLAIEPPRGLSLVCALHPPLHPHPFTKISSNFYKKKENLVK